MIVRWIAIRFKNAVKFPYFSVTEGFTWILGTYAPDYIAAKEAGLPSFPFANGMCLFTDIEELYDGSNRSEAYKSTKQ